MLRQCPHPFLRREDVDAPVKVVLSNKDQEALCGLCGEHSNAQFAFGEQSRFSGSILCFILKRQFDGVNKNCYLQC